MTSAGRPFRFLLVNAYYLQEEAARGRFDRVEETFSKAYAMGARVVRTWGFHDHPEAPEAIQRARLEYNEPGLLALDGVLDRAAAHGLRLILPLVNYWDDYGGIRQWMRWNGFAGRSGDPRFFTEPALRDHYARHVATMLARSNARNGRVYAEDPTILAWELVNEPRGRGLDPEGRLLADWVAFAAKALRKAGARQLIALGDEGFDVSLEGSGRSPWKRTGGRGLFSPRNGSSFRLHLDCPDVDLASCHWYPESWRIRRGQEEEAGVTWIEQHARLARAAGKPLVLGEFGLRGDGLPLDVRRRAYRRWLRAADQAGLVGAGPWLFTYDDRPEEWDAFTFRWPTGAAIDAPESGCCAVLADAAACWAEGSPPFPLPARSR